MWGCWSCDVSRENSYCDSKNVLMGLKDKAETKKEKAEWFLLLRYEEKGEQSKGGLGNPSPIASCFMFILHDPLMDRRENENALSFFFSPC